MIFKSLDTLLEKSKSEHILKYQRAGLAAADTFLRRPSTVTDRAPHIRDATDLKRYMFMVVIALLPCTIFGIWNTGRNSYLSIGYSSFSFIQAMIEGLLYVLPLIFLSYAVGGLCEVIFAQIRKHEVAEGFLVTGLLYPLICPATIPWWMYILGIIFGVIVGKELFGGTGQNILNPALTARAFLFFAYPAAISGDVWIAKPFYKLEDGSYAITKWTTIAEDKIALFLNGSVEAINGYTGATALQIVEEQNIGENALVNLYSIFPVGDIFLGLMPGSIGETSVLMCLIGAFFLIITGVGSWRVMLFGVIGAISTAYLIKLSSIDSSPDFFNINPIEHIYLGGFAFGIVFMATDPVSGPIHKYSKMIYGFCIGMLCVLIRLFNAAFPEGMMLSILFMNLFAALIDHYVIQYVQRKRKKNAKS